jgi:hypothetical protein
LRARAHGSAKNQQGSGGEVEMASHGKDILREYNPTGEEE